MKAKSSFNLLPAMLKDEKVREVEEKMTKAKSVKPIKPSMDYLTGKHDGYEQGKKDAEEEIEILKQCIAIDTHQQGLLRNELKLRISSDRHSIQCDIDRIKRAKKEGRKQTLDEVLKELRELQKDKRLYYDEISEREVILEDWLEKELSK